MIRRMLFQAANCVLDVAEGAVRRARAWIDLNYPPQDIDELVAQIEQIEKSHRRRMDAECQSFSELFDASWDNVVHLPRRPL